MTIHFCLYKGVNNTRYCAVQDESAVHARDKFINDDVINVKNRSQYELSHN